MLQPGGELDLALEALGADRFGDLRMEHLERHRAVMAEVVREVHRGESAAAEFALNAVAVVQGRFELVARDQSRTAIGRGTVNATAAEDRRPER
jgi:hypothetical protein